MLSQDKNRSKFKKSKVKFEALVGKVHTIVYHKCYIKVQIIVYPKGYKVMEGITAISEF